MKIVDIFLAAPKSEARGVIATLLGAHGFRVRWTSPWAAQGDRGSSFGYLFSPGNPLLARFTVGAQVMDDGGDCVVRLERRFVPTNQQQGMTALALADEFENLCDEITLAFSTDGRVKRTVAYGTPPLVIVDAHLAKPPPPILPLHQSVAATHTSPVGPAWVPSAAPPAPPAPPPIDDDPSTGVDGRNGSAGGDAPRRTYPPPPPPRRPPKPADGRVEGPR